MAVTRRHGRRIDTRLLIVLFVAFACIAAFAAVRLATGLRPYQAAEQEYDALRADYAPNPISGQLDDGEAARVVPATVELARNPAEINPDYAGWLEITGTDGGRLPDISYPVVQGKDNDKYLTTTFEGKENKLGAIFLDCRSIGGFDAPHAIVYGHNSKDGEMFGSLADLLALEPEDYPDITITLPDGAALVYRIFAVRQTDIHDPAYGLDSADDAESAARLLTLSTCTDSGDRDKRLLVLAALAEE